VSLMMKTQIIFKMSEFYYAKIRLIAQDFGIKKFVSAADYD
jgi:hypothetical protein